MMNDIKEAIQTHQEMCNDTRKKLEEFGILGPWMNEPDRVEFKSYGLDCLLVRNHSMFQWCGYVGVSLDHPNVKRLVKKELKFGSIERDYLEDENDDLNVHGGITYRESCKGFICHITEPDDKLFWFGFDCAHFLDFTPGMEVHRKMMRKFEVSEDMKEIQKSSDILSEKIRDTSMPDMFGGTYHDINYVMEQTKCLARQLADAK